MSLPAPPLPAWPAFRRGVACCTAFAMQVNRYAHPSWRVAAAGAADRRALEALRGEEAAASWQGFDFYCPRIRWVMALTADPSACPRFATLLGAIEGEFGGELVENAVSSDAMLTAAYASRSLLRGIEAPFAQILDCPPALAGRALMVSAVEELPVAVAARLRLLSPAADILPMLQPTLAREVLWSSMFRIWRWQKAFRP